MAARKLQQEIDKTLKKVAEGVEVFDGIWEKVHDPDLASVKEKNEAELKKEVKKLQKFRDQVKTWLAGTEVKDKAALADARRAVERCMEAFKVCERESKTRAFSREGLAAAAARVDPREARRAEARDWIAATVTALGEHVETLDGELEALTAGGGNKRARAKAPPPRAAALEAAIARHRAHVARLEQLLRLLDNEAVSPEEVDPVREALDDYLASHTGDDALDVEDVMDGGLGEDPDDAYDGLLDRLDAAAAALPAVPSAAAIKGAAAVKDAPSAASKDSGRGKGAAGTASTATSAPPPASPRTSADRAPPPASPAAGAGGGRRPADGSTASSSPKAAAGGGGGGGGGGGAPPAPPPPSSSTPGRPAGWKRGDGDAEAGGGGAASNAGGGGGPGAGGAAPPPQNAFAAADAAEADLAPPAPIPAVPPSVLQSLLTACAPRSIPTPADSAWPAVPPRVRSLPRGQPAPSYPASRPPALDAPALFERLDAEALFFAFYYQPGSHQQFLAARELKRQSWRYHTQHGAWFQRHEEPSAATDEYERGTYVYFDYNVVHDDAQAGWCYRLKQDFTFRYDSLEQEDEF